MQGLKGNKEISIRKNTLFEENELIDDGL